MAVLGVDVGGTSVRVGLADRGGARQLGAECPVPKSTAGLVDHIVSAWSGLADGAGADRRPESVVVALPGRTGDRVPDWLPNLSHLEGEPLADTLADRFGVPVERCRLVNDGQAALIAESVDGAAVGKRNVLLVVLGTGIGGAVLMDGRLIRGRHGCAGSFGWLSAADVRPDGVNGSWEQVASGTALELLSARVGGAHRAVADARDGDPEARRVLTTYADRVGVGLAALASVLDPDLVLIGGGVSAAFDVLSGPLLAAFAAHASPVVRDTPVRVAALGPQAGLIGALIIGLDPGRIHDH